MALAAARGQEPRTATPSLAITALPSEATSERRPRPEPVAEPRPRPGPELTSTLIPTPDPGAKPTPKPASGRGPKSIPGTPPQESSPPVSQTKRSADDSGGDGPGEGTVYTWKDGNRIMRVVLQDDLAVQKRAANTLQDVAVAGVGKDSAGRKQDNKGGDFQPVFRSESGGGLMTLPGGVMLALDPEWDQARVESFFSRNEISTDQTSGLDFLENGFLVETEPGFPSLELANALAGQKGVLISSPNWWREVEAK